ncbi:carbohydrate binding domain-containing protein [Saccharicrinis sp. GN24d3]|uniref:carbohydrate binding domain-containing protein n=1 Tax=Saccharicrinis sp. GN24d3 TaxID=3458416 RepID=UPI004036CD0F
MRTPLLFLSFFLLTISCFANPPKPPIGKRWAINPLYSDEFNGTELDLNKWYNYHPTWVGRPPGLFMESQIKVEDGYLKIWGEKMDEEVIVNGNAFNIKCGAVISRKQTAHYGYYECKFKANKTTLSSTFWFSNRKNFDGPEECNDKYSQEWDIQECIGREGDFDGSWFAKGMHSNAHLWYTDCEGTRHDYRATEARFEDTQLASEDFNIYGGWWKDANSATYYYNNGEPLDQTFYDQVLDKPFSNPMGMNLVVETYPFPWIELPNDEELADPDKNGTLYDWVRAYVLVDAFEPYITEEEPLIKNGDFETGDLSGWIGWGSPGAAITDNTVHIANGTYACRIVGGGAPEQILDLKPNTDYTITCNAKAVTGSITLGVKDNGSGEKINGVEVTGTDYQPYTLKFNSGNYAVKLYYYAQANEEGYIDDIMVEEDNPAPPVEVEPLALYDENVTLNPNFSQDWTKQEVSIPLVFQANQDREMHLKLKNSDDIVVSDTVLTAYAGYANAVVNIKVDSVLTKGAYSLYSDIRPIDGLESDIIYTESISLNDVSVRSTKAETLKVYPSPASNLLHINGIQVGTQYNIYDMKGILVDSEPYNGEPILISDLKPGMYIIGINERKGRFVKR